MVRPGTPRLGCLPNQNVSGGVPWVGRRMYGVHELESPGRGREVGPTMKDQV